MAKDKMIYKVAMGANDGGIPEHAQRNLENEIEEYSTNGFFPIGNMCISMRPIVENEHISDNALIVMTLLMGKTGE